MLKRHPVTPLTSLTLLSLLGVASACVGRPAGLPVQLYLTALPTSTASLDSDSAEGSPTSTPRPATATPDDDIARLVRNWPAEETTVEVTGYVHVIGRPSRSDLWGRDPDGKLTLSPMRGGNGGLRLYDRPFPIEFSLGNLREVRLPESESWLALQPLSPQKPSPFLAPRAEDDIGLPSHGRFRLRLGGCRANDAERTTCPPLEHGVMLEKVLEDLGTWRFNEGWFKGTESTALLRSMVMPPGWVAYKEEGMHMTLRVPESWKIEAKRDGLALVAPDWPDRPLLMTVYSALTFSSIATVDAGPPLQPWEDMGMSLDAPRILARGTMVTPVPQTLLRHFCAPPDRISRLGRRTHYSLAAGCIAIAMNVPGADKVLVFQQAYGRGDDADPRILFLFGEVVRRIGWDGRTTAPPGAR